MAEQKRYRYWNIKNPPLLLQGFDLQTVVAALVNEDRRQFQLETNRGVVFAVDYISVNLAVIAAGQDETVWNDALIDCLAGGQELLRDAPAERYDYDVDLGNEVEQKILTWINGGQVVDSILKINPASIAPVPNIATQFQAYYSTEDLEEWRKSYKWKNGQGLKRRTYDVAILAAQSGTFSIEDVLPKNQGEIIGFSLLYYGANIGEGFANLAVDGIEIIKNVYLPRFSRFCQRDPEVFLIPLNPGSTFKLDLVNPNTTGNDGILYVTFYFDN
jgi:hypothetical protein